MDSQEYISLLKEKQEILNDILNYTKSKNFEISEEEIERVEYYLKRRQRMYDKLLEIENRLNLINIDVANNMEVKSIININNELISNILKLDAEKKKMMDSILGLLKKEIKSIKNTSKAHNGYLGIYSNMAGGSLFDSSR